MRTNSKAYTLKHELTAFSTKGQTVILGFAAGPITVTTM